jgi:hypothetical protein
MAAMILYGLIITLVAARTRAEPAPRPALAV